MAESYSEGKEVLDMDQVYIDKDDFLDEEDPHSSAARSSWYAKRSLDETVCQAA
jgi:hypothetical protein